MVLVGQRGMAKGMKESLFPLTFVLPLVGDRFAGLHHLKVIYS